MTKKHSSTCSYAFPFRKYHGLLMLLNQFRDPKVQTLLKHLISSKSPKFPRRFFPNSRKSHITTVLTAIRNSNFTQVLQCPKSMTTHLQKSFLSKSLIPTSDLLNGKTVKTLTGCLGMKNTGGNSTRSDQRLERNSNPTVFTSKDHTTRVFTTDLTPADEFWQYVTLKAFLLPSLFECYLHCQKSIMLSGTMLSVQKPKRITDGFIGKLL